MGKAAVAQDDHSEDLKQAFLAFNQLSEQLTSSYQELEEKVTHLNSELVQSQNQRLEELAEKERLAERLDSLLNALPAAVVVLDAAGIVQEANPAACTMLGEPLQGLAWRDIIGRAFALGGDSGYDLRLKNGRLVSPETCPLGSEPGQIPPISAWWARLATKPRRASPAKTGVTTVTSGGTFRVSKKSWPSFRFVQNSIQGESPCLSMFFLVILKGKMWTLKNFCSLLRAASARA